MQKEQLLDMLNEKLMQIEKEGKIDKEILSEIKEIKALLDTMREVENIDVVEKEKDVLDSYFKGDMIGEKEARSIGLTTSNGAFINLDIHTDIIEKLYEECPFLDLAQVFHANRQLRIIKEETIGDANIVDELAQITEGNVTFSSIELQIYKIASLTNVTLEMLHNAGLDISEYITGILIKRLARTLNKLFLTGTGLREPQGILQSNNTYNFTANFGLDELIDMQGKIDNEYLDKAKWIMNRNTYNHIAKMADSVGDYYLKYFVENGKLVAYLLGLPIVIDNNMPDMLLDNRFIALTDLKESYAINISKEMQVKNLSELNMANGFETFVGYVLADGKIMNNEALVVGIAG